MRPRKPEHLHELQNTVPQIKPADPTPALGRPKVPPGISAIARRTYRRLCDTLEARRHLTPGDAELLRLFAVTFDRHVKAMQKLREEGEVRIYFRLDSQGQQCPTEKANIWLKVATDAEKFMLAALAALGLTPLNKSKVQVRDEKPTEVDPIEEMMRAPADVQDVNPLDEIDEDSVLGIQ